jgi:hypothetical protein
MFQRASYKFDYSAEELWAGCGAVHDDERRTKIRYEYEDENDIYVVPLGSTFLFTMWT